MDVLPKGLMFILNMSEDRKRSDVDVKNTEHVFKQIGYEIETHSDLTAEVRACCFVDLLSSYCKNIMSDTTNMVNGR